MEFQVKRAPCTAKSCNRIDLDTDIKAYLSCPAPSAESKYLFCGDVRIVEKHEKELCLALMQECVLHLFGGINIIVLLSLKQLRTGQP